MVYCRGFFYYRPSSTSGSTTVTSRTYYPCLDHLGSIVKLVDSAGSVAYAATYDAWGRRTVSVNSLSFQRGYTGHEHLDSFGLVNMNGRMYDPALGRFLSPDPYVQLPDFSQNFNRYSYCLNNPLMYTDPSGEFIIGFFSGLLKGFVKNITRPWKAWDDGLKGAWNSMKISGGLFVGNGLQIVSCLTWELPQTLLGLGWSHIRNITWRVDQVEYFDGATFVINEYAKKKDGMTLGNFININDRNVMPIDGNGDFDPTQDNLYMHEYGHYLQSQNYGWGYLFSVGVPSLFSAWKNRLIENGLTTHRVKWYELSANRKAYKYFTSKYGDIDWEEDKYPFHYP